MMEKVKGMAFTNTATLINQHSYQPGTRTGQVTIPAGVTEAQVVVTVVGQLVTVVDDLGNSFQTFTLNGGEVQMMASYNGVVIGVGDFKTAGTVTFPFHNLVPGGTVNTSVTVLNTAVTFGAVANF